MNPQTVIAANLCRASYDDTDPRFTKVNEQSFGVIVVGNVTYLVFRGTHNAAGWLHDFSAVPVLSKGGYLAHAGFVEATEELWNPVCKSLDGRPGPWVITGHSLGGALAVLFGEQIKVPIITFGCPRVYSRLNGHFPDMVHSRVVNRGDIVTMVPEVLMWKHLVDPIEIGPENEPGAEWHDINLYIANLTTS